MNTNKAKLPWQRRYNWRLWYYQHQRCIKTFIVGMLVGLAVYAGTHLMEQYVHMLDAMLHARTESAQAMSIRMSGAPKTPEDQIAFKEPVGWKMAMNWCRAGWKEECR